MLVAADTFRAVIIEWLTERAHRAGVETAVQQEGPDPATVIRDAMTAAKSRHADTLVRDTVGYLHNKKSLTEELKKINWIIDKEYPGAYRETLVVLNGIAGQNALSQAGQFMEVAKMTSIILTRLGGTAKGGTAMTIQSGLSISVKYVDIREQIDDSQKLDTDGFVNTLFAMKES